MRKELISCVCAACLTLCMSSCSSGSSGVSPSSTSLSGDSASGPSHPGIIHQDNPYEWLEEYDLGAAKGYDTLSLTGIDSLGRVIKTSAAELDKYTAGIYYNPALGFHFSGGIYDVSKIMEQYGQEKGKEIIYFSDSKLSPAGAYHYVAEPLFGYYKSSDSYIARKHIDMLTAAGIDYIVLDTTNGWIYPEAVKNMAKYIAELRNQGWDAPQIVYYVHSLNNKTVREIYSGLYQQPEYEDAWYKKDGKPVIIAYTDTEKDKAEAATRGVTDFSGPEYAPLSQEILDYFYFVEPRWPNDTMASLINTPIYDPDLKTGYTNIEWAQPLPVRQTSLGTYMNVSVASHPAIPFSFSITHDARNYSRAYNPASGRNESNGMMSGTYYQSCWGQAINKRPDTIMLVMWNYWGADKLPAAGDHKGEYMFVDSATVDYSLVIEPAKGYFQDNYYMQTVRNMRNYKYSGEAPARKAQTIDINGSYAQWYIVDGVYRQIGETAYRRRSSSIDNSISYRTALPENNIQEIRVAHDKDNLYFMIRTEKDIKARKEGALNWMNLFIGAGEPALNGWEGYGYVLNRSGSDSAADIIKLNADFSGETVGQASMKIDKNRMFLSVPRSLIGMDNQTSFYFKAADSVAAPEDIMEYYVSGSVMPMGRLSYEYKMAS